MLKYVFGKKILVFFLGIQLPQLACRMEIYEFLFFDICVTLFEDALTNFSTFFVLFRKKKKILDMAQK